MAKNANCYNGSGMNRLSRHMSVGCLGW
jgi:hypothetical protein